jgi:predicted Zn-dependent protease
MWWNNLAGSYLRLGKPGEAVKILEPLTNRFANDYGIHANLGTAYHLLGRYVEAEREIRRDTEINTNAHFGLEKYHLALLQYLVRDENYKARHLYVDEFTKVFLAQGGRGSPEGHQTQSSLTTEKISESERKNMDSDAREIFQKHPSSFTFDDSDQLYFIAVLDPAPDYMSKWDLGADSKLTDGVVYMGLLNQKEPACWVMMGALALQHSEYHLAKTAFERAIQLGSIQSPVLRMHLGTIEQQFANTRATHTSMVVLLAGLAIVFAIGCYLFGKFLEFWGGKKFNWATPKKP